MPKFNVKFQRVISVRHRVEETLEIVIDAKDQEEAKEIGETLLETDNLDDAFEWEEENDDIVGSDFVASELINIETAPGDATADYDASVLRD